MSESQSENQPLVARLQDVANRIAMTPVQAEDAEIVQEGADVLASVVARMSVIDHLVHNEELTAYEVRAAVEDVLSERRK